MKVYLKNINTGAVKTLEEWKKEAIKFFTNLFNEEQDLQDEFKTLESYLKWVDEQGYFYTDLIECDEDGNPIDYAESLY